MKIIPCRKVRREGCILHQLQLADCIHICIGSISACPVHKTVSVFRGCLYICQRDCRAVLNICDRSVFCPFKGLHCMKLFRASAFSGCHTSVFSRLILDPDLILVRRSIRISFRTFLIQRIVYIHYILALVRCHDSFARLLDVLKRVVLAVIL